MIYYRSDGIVEWSDLLRTTNSALLVSSYLHSLLNELCPQYSSWESRILDEDGTLFEKEYFSINIETTAEVLNLEKTRCYKDYDCPGYKPGYPYLSLFDKIVLSKKLIKNLNADYHLFRMAEQTTIMICDEYAKNLLEKNKITGVKYTELKVK